MYAADETVALKLGRSKRWRDATLDQIRYFAAHAAIPERLAVQAVAETVMRFRAAWSAEAAHVGLPNAARIAIDRHVSSLPITREV